MVQLSLEFVRAQFPGFAEPSLRGWSFFDNAGGSFVCRYVIWRLHRFYRERKVQPFAPYPASTAGGEEMDEARRRLALVLGVDEDELCLGPSTTQNAYVLSQAFREWLRPGEAIVVTDQDHEANSGAWRRLAQSGVDVREWKIDPESGHLNPDDLVPLLEDGKVRLVCFPHCSNVIAEINDVPRICRMVRSAGGYSCVDGVSYAPHGIPDVSKLGADIYMFSAYKTYGPHLGVMTVRKSLGERLPNQGHSFNGTKVSTRFSPAGPDHAQVAAMAGIPDYVDKLYHHHTKVGRDLNGRAAFIAEAMRAREIKLMAPLIDYLDTRPDLRLLGSRSARSRAPTFAFDLKKPARPVARKLSERGLMCDGGDFYAVRPLAAMGISPEQGVLRLSFVHYTSEEDIEKVIQGLDEVVR